MSNPRTVTWPTPEAREAVETALRGIGFYGWKCEEIARATLDALAPHVAQQRTEALREAADAWQTGQWADAPRRADRVQERLANAQHVNGWLRARADLEAER